MQLEQTLLNCEKAFILQQSARIHCTFVFYFDVHSNYLSTLRVNLLVKKYEPRFIVAF